MVIAWIAIFAVALLAAFLLKRTAERRELERYSITPEALHTLLTAKADVLLYDLRHPLDLLGDSVIIPGAKWIDPQEVHENPSLLPCEKGLVVYCTCPSAKTSRAILHRALTKGFSQIKFIKGGLEGWRARGFPVEPYKKSFRLDSGISTDSAISR